jgi:putative ABC transport system ATP-binding protein
MVIVELKNLNVYYDKGKPNEWWALRNISLQIEASSYIAFFGASGSGKTTLLYTISGMEKPESGQVLVAGKDITRFSQKELAIYRQMTVGIVFQQFNLIPSISVLDNIALPMSFLGIPLEKRQKKALILLKRFGIDDLSNRLPFELSGGQQQRVGIARALANDPPIVIADEPLGNLDSENANKVLDFLRDLQEKDGRTIIMVTHESWSLKDARVIFYIKDGQIVKTEKRKGREAPFVPPTSPNLPEEISKAFKNIFENITKANQVRHEHKEDGKHKVLAILQERGRIMNNDVENLLGISDATATRYLEELCKEGKLIREGKFGKGVFYTPKPFTKKS